MGSERYRSSTSSTIVAMSSRQRVDREPLDEELVATVGEPPARRRRRLASASSAVGERVGVARPAQPGVLAVGQHLARRPGVSAVTTGRPTASASNTLFGITRCALGDVPKIPRHTWLAAISRGKLLVRAATEEAKVAHPKLGGETLDRVFRRAGADDVDLDLLADALQEMRGSHDVLEPVQRDEARVDEHAERCRSSRKGAGRMTSSSEPTQTRRSLRRGTPTRVAK